jgi:ParB family chromosome partitioning protein
MGLSALLGGGPELLEEAANSPVQSLPIELLRASPLQPRRRFVEAEIAALAQSVREKGILQPLLVRPASGGDAGYEIVAGERRWRAAQQAGLHVVPVLVRELGDAETLELALIENVQRADLSAIEEAEAYKRLMDEFGHTQEALATALGKSRSHIANTLRLLGLPQAVRHMVENGELSAGHGRALLGARRPMTLAMVVSAGQLSVRDTEALVRREGRQATTSARASAPDPNLAQLEQALSRRLGLDITITRKGRGGVVTLRFSQAEQLDALLARLN